MRGGQKVNPVPSSAFLVFPRENKHVVFDGRLFHGVVGSLAREQEQAAEQAFEQAEGAHRNRQEQEREREHRYTFLVNWWAARPSSLRALPPSQLPRSALHPHPGALAQLAHDRPQQAQAEAPLPVKRWVAPPEEEASPGAGSGSGSGWSDALLWLNTPAPAELLLLPLPDAVLPRAEGAGAAGAEAGAGAGAEAETAGVHWLQWAVPSGRERGRGAGMGAAVAQLTPALLQVRASPFPPVARPVLALPSAFPRHSPARSSKPLPLPEVRSPATDHCPSCNRRSTCSRRRTSHARCCCWRRARCSGGVQSLCVRGAPKTHPLQCCSCQLLKRVRVRVRTRSESCERAARELQESCLERRDKRQCPYLLSLTCERTRGERPA